MPLHASPVLPRAAVDERRPWVRRRPQQARACLALQDVCTVLDDMVREQAGAEAGRAESPALDILCAAVEPGDVAFAVVGAPCRQPAAPPPPPPPPPPSVGAGTPGDPHALRMPAHRHFRPRSHPQAQAVMALLANSASCCFVRMAHH